MTDIRQALEEAFKQTSPRLRSSEHSPQECRDSDILAYRFHRLLDAEAWIDAVLMLLPNGWHWGGHSDTEFYVYKRRPDMRGGYSRIVEATGPTPAHALLAACLKAKEQADG